MFKAVVKGKSGSVRADIQNDNVNSTPVGLDVPNIREDVLSAAVFSRLAYLPANRFWQLLCSVYSNLPYREYAELKNIEFWPNWAHPNKERKFTEPDIFLQFEIGDPKKSVDVIVEVKRFETGTVQSDTQHIDQISSYFADQDVIDKGEALYFLTLGGLGNDPRNQIDRLRRIVLKKLKYDSFNELNISGASWSMMSNAVSNQSKNWPDINRTLLSDLEEVLSYAGFKKRTYFSEEANVFLPNLAIEAVETFYKREV